VVKSVLKQPRPGFLFNSGFQPRFDPERCLACGTCVERCPPTALEIGENDLPVVDLNRCFGCAACATGCQQEAILMEPKQHFPEPPRTLKDLVVAVKASAGK
jgi:NAD-dependent dihydropyrimidine dehydrogenase PreA subunit